MLQLMVMTVARTRIMKELEVVMAAIMREEEEDDRSVLRVDCGLGQVSRRSPYFCPLPQRFSKLSKHHGYLQGCQHPILRVPNPVGLGWSLRKGAFLTSS